MFIAVNQQILDNGIGIFTSTKNCEVGFVFFCVES